MSIVRFQMFQDVGGGAATTQSFTLTGPLDIDPGSNQYLIPVSGMNEPFAVGQLLSLEINATIIDLSEIDSSITNPSFNVTIETIGSASIIGSDLIGTVFLYGNITPLSSGVAPYTGNFICDFNGNPLGFDDFVGDIVNGDWIFDIQNSGGSTYTLNSVTLTFAL